MPSMRNCKIHGFKIADSAISEVQTGKCLKNI